MLELFDRTNLTWSEKVAYIAYQLKLIDTKVDAPLAHIFEHGMYIREMRLPAGAIVVGRQHIHGHRTQLVSGIAMLVGPDGRQLFEGPAEIHTKTGDQIVAHAVTDIVARTYHPNPSESRDITALEDEWFAPAEPVLQLGEKLYARLK